MTWWREMVKGEGENGEECEMVLKFLQQRWISPRWCRTQTLTHMTNSIIHATTLKTYYKKHKTQDTKHKLSNSPHLNLILRIQQQGLKQSRLGGLLALIGTAVAAVSTVHAVDCIPGNLLGDKPQPLGTLLRWSRGELLRLELETEH